MGLSLYVVVPSLYAVGLLLYAVVPLLYAVGLLLYAVVPSSLLRKIKSVMCLFTKTVLCI